MESMLPKIASTGSAQSKIAAIGCLKLGQRSGEGGDRGWVGLKIAEIETERDPKRYSNLTDDVVYGNGRGTWNAEHGVSLWEKEREPR